MARPWFVSVGILPPVCVVVGALHVVRTVPAVVVSYAEAPFACVPVEPEPEWETDHVDVRLDVDPGLHGKAALARELPSVEVGHLSSFDPDNSDGRSGDFELSSRGNLRIVFGTSNHFSGHVMDLRIVHRADAGVDCGLLATNFYDEGPPFSRAWSDVTGFVHVSSLEWSREGEIVVSFDVRGTLGGRETHDEGLIRLRLR